MVTFEVVVGLLLRRAFRRMLRAAMISFTEEKGFTDSQFIITCSPRTRAVIMDHIERFNS
jgi:hypothetical protein